MIEVLETYPFEYVEGTTLIAREPIGVCGLITPWNWPINQIACKVLPALAAGCTVVLKPSEEAPIDAIIWSEIVHAAGTPRGVCNMVQGTGAVVGEAMSAHPDTKLGPVINAAQFEKIQRLIQTGIDEGAELVTGAPGRPEHLNRGFHVRRTIFAGVTNDMTIAREEIFGPVLTILPYKDEEEVVRLANDTLYGLAAYVQAKDVEHGRQIAARMRAGNVHLNYPMGDTATPFGGYRQSGNGREYGKWGLEEFLETKAAIGYQAAWRRSGAGWPQAAGAAIFVPCKTTPLSHLAASQ